KVRSRPVLSITSYLLSSHVLNGDFEQWNGNAPTQWSVIDSGIAVSPTSVANTKRKAIATTVNTYSLRAGLVARLNR
ncbi:hypothetical protein AB4209_20220, partial [Vibrio sp. 10N.286.48.C11]